MHKVRSVRRRRCDSDHKWLKRCVHCLLLELIIAAGARRHAAWAREAGRAEICIPAMVPMSTGSTWILRHDGMAYVMHPRAASRTQADHCDLFAMPCTERGRESSGFHWG